MNAAHRAHFSFGVQTLCIMDIPKWNIWGHKISCLTAYCIPRIHQKLIRLKEPRALFSPAKKTRVGPQYELRGTPIQKKLHSYYHGFLAWVVYAYVT